MSIKREADSGVTLICFGLGVGCSVVAWGWVVAAAVACIGFALVGELQRKTNQIMDLLEQKDRD